MKRLLLLVLLLLPACKESPTEPVKKEPVYLYSLTEPTVIPLNGVLSMGVYDLSECDSITVGFQAVSQIAPSGIGVGLGRWSYGSCEITERNKVYSYSLTVRREKIIRADSVAVKLHPSQESTLSNVVLLLWK